MVLILDGHPRSEVGRYPIVTIFYAIEKLVEKNGGKSNKGRGRHEGRHMRVDNNSPLMRRLRGQKDATREEIGNDGDGDD